MRVITIIMFGDFMSYAFKHNDCDWDNKLVILNDKLLNCIAPLII